MHIHFVNIKPLQRIDNNVQFIRIKYKAHDKGFEDVRCNFV